MSGNLALVRKTPAGRNTTCGKCWRTVENLHRVDASTWKNWGEPARTVFNDLFLHMRDAPKWYRDPRQEPVSPKHWLTTAWNAAWEAAEATQRAVTTATAEA